MLEACRQAFSLGCVIVCSVSCLSVAEESPRNRAYAAMNCSWCQENPNIAVYFLRNAFKYGVFLLTIPGKCQQINPLVLPI